MKTVFQTLFLMYFLSSCQEDIKINAIEGQIFSDCQTSLPETELALKINVGSDFQDPFIIGSTISGKNGNYRLSYELESDKRGTADLLLIKSSGFETLIRRINLNESFKTNLILANKAKVILSLSSNQALALNDTLFYSIENFEEDRFTINPSNGIIDTLEFTVPNQLQGFSTATLFYGIGTQEFSRSKEALSIPDSSFQHLPLTLFGCGDPLLVTISINN